ncbi:DUF389 domain-containing protein [Winogradskyella alexanderae]|uniref:DUF389 domain-containing protein n=1 Tax=Winogradskyella alexanderae TaxID=2877123 RepID=A0ABS7XXF7_9FLAO|nr:DUF389 domain-containing protein [Winogradskyella alexanderae]MCA0133582.1 DUF389 domain-containing protein [Winogradskyella alexanderae]
MEENKFNFSDEEERKQIDKDKAVEEQKEAIKKDAKGLFASIKSFLSELLDFREDTDRDATIDAIKGDISFKGATAWILICSIMVASVGLNANSTAVVIGAMLISPLMGPILGVGMSIAINDIDTLRKSLINLVTMIVLSLLTAFLFFKFFPTADVGNSEIFGRTKPDFRDVLIAFFGGLALIIARTKKGTIASVIFGVAIATALMPPLCVAGYGLANDWSAFIGAMYLFTINSIFIALATFIVLKLLRFPMLKYANSAKRKRIARLATLVAIIVMIPAGITFWDVYKESNFNMEAESFRDSELSGLPHADYIKRNFVFRYNSDRGSFLELNSFGLDEIPESTIALLRSRINDYPALVRNETQLFYDPIKNSDVEGFKYMKELRLRDSLDLLSKDERINYLQSRVKALEIFEKNQIPFASISEEVKLNYENIERLALANVVSSDFKKLDTTLMFRVKWKDSLSSDVIIKEERRLEKWLRFKLDVDTVLIARD